MDTNFSRDASRFTHMWRGFGGYGLRAVLVSCVALAIAAGPSLAWAGDSKNHKKHYLVNKQRIERLKERVSDLRRRLKHHERHNDNRGGTAGSVEDLQDKVTKLQEDVAALLQADAKLMEVITALQSEDLAVRVAALENSKPQGGVAGLENYMEINTNPINGVNGPHLIFKGVNVHVRSGSGQTVDGTGLGNLIIGYNENPAGAGINRLGSHNLVGGQMNSFSSSGGLVFGTNNTISNRFAAIFGGDRNMANGLNASILGGGLNTASGQYSTVYGGQLNNSSSNFDVKPQVLSGGGSTPTPTSGF